MSYNKEMAVLNIAITEYVSPRPLHAPISQTLLISLKSKSDHQSQLV